jgi:hypothetical protein
LGGFRDLCLWIGQHQAIVSQFLLNNKYKHGYYRELATAANPGVIVIAVALTAFPISISHVFIFATLGGREVIARVRWRHFDMGNRLFVLWFTVLSFLLTVSWLYLLVRGTNWLLRIWR